MILVIIVVVILAASVIIALAIINSKKKKDEYNYTENNHGINQYDGMTTASQSQPVNTYPDFNSYDSEETTLLSDDGETVLLKNDTFVSFAGGFLTSRRTNNKIRVDSQEFIIGRERTKVNFCVNENMSVGRVHAKIVNHAGQAYLVDLNAVNGTFLNEKKCNPMHETPLKSGDLISLSNEEFIYTE